MKDYFEASRKVAFEIAHLEVLRRSIPAKITTLGESFAAQLVADGAKLVGTWLEILDNEAPGVRRYYHMTRIERSPLIPWADEAARNSPGNLRKDRVLYSRSDKNIRMWRNFGGYDRHFKNLAVFKEWLKNAHANKRKFEETSEATK